MAATSAWKSGGAGDGDSSGGDWRPGKHTLILLLAELDCAAKAEYDRVIRNAWDCEWPSLYRSWVGEGPRGQNG
ncbi:hypothetical protein M0R45_017960 [Rubus argutus]|uniref:Uncharacterized protein n=1 Tax=Rubus argutus TaxID=59490 RepID=A0AAW1XZK8_RUBAR